LFRFAKAKPAAEKKGGKDVSEAQPEDDEAGSN